AFQSKSLGYINNQHQHLKQLKEGLCITLYMPLDEESAVAERKKAREKDLNYWKDVVLTQLEEMHAGITKNVIDIEIGIWGHGMILPKPGLTKGDTRELLSQPIQNKLFFAHTDLSAYSVFEEAFDQGLRASQKILELRT
ncbi:MAG: FAD-dependent oxidoreductase, partial [Bacteroidia bacterium]|nr:FAD-dependent oxidoreductase [Bacteroidia bacterium]